MVAEWCRHCKADISLKEQMEQGGGRIMPYFTCINCGKPSKIHRELYD